MALIESIITSIIVLIILAWYTYIYRWSIRENVLFFPDDKLLCRTTIDPIINGTIGEVRVRCYYKNCQRNHGNKKDPHSSLLELFKLLNKAKKQIDLCIFLITSDLIAQFLIRLKNKKRIKIRLITDSSGDEKMKINNQRARLEQEGIEVKTNSSVQDGALMHNKFVVIDRKTVICGSFNWTITAITKNHEAVVVTSSKNIVAKFDEKFKEMWASEEFEV